MASQGRRAGGHHDVGLHGRVSAREIESSPKLATAGGLSSGIDLALRVVERYFGRPAAERTAAYMEYQGRGWVV